MFALVFFSNINILRSKKFRTRSGLTDSALQLIEEGKGEALRIRAILRSLVPIHDLEGVISSSFCLPSVTKGKLGGHCVKKSPLLCGFSLYLYFQMVLLLNQTFP